MMPFSGAYSDYYDLVLIFELFKEEKYKTVYLKRNGKVQSCLTGLGPDKKIKVFKCLLFQCS